MTDERLPFDSTSTGRLKRKISSVTEVLDELARQMKADPYGKGRLFDAAQRVCTEELRRLKLEGGEPATLAVLVERARGILDPSRRTHSEAGPAGGSTEEEPFDLSSPFAIPPPAEAAPQEPGSVVFAPEPAAPEPPPPAAPLPRETGRRVQPPAPSAAGRRELTAPDFMAPRPRRSAAPRLLLGVLLAALALGGGYWYLRLRQPGPVPAASARPAPARRPREAAAPERPALPAPATRTPTATPSPVPEEGASTAPKPPAPAPKPPAAAAGESRAAPADESIAAPASRQTEAPSQSRAGTMVSAQWAGRAPAYMLHFSSYKSRQNAERDAERLSKQFGKPAHVLEVSLGSEGVWYRVLVGEFPTAEEAFAFRAQLASRKTPEVGLVFRVTGPGR